MTSRRTLIVSGSLIALASLSLGVFLLRPDSTIMAVSLETIRNEDGIFIGRWTFSSGRRWESFGKATRPGEHLVVLVPPGSSDGSAIRFLKESAGMGADRIVYEIEARRSLAHATPGMVDIELKRTMRGNASGTPKFTSTSTIRVADGPWADQIRVLQGGAVAVPLPARIRLGVFGDLSEVIEFR